MGGKKVWVVVALALVLCCGLFGCKRSKLATNFGNTITDWQTADTPRGQTEPSEIVELSSPAFGSETGFDVTAWPDDDSLAPELYFAVDGWLGQIEYRTADGRLLVVRVARVGDKLLSLTYRESHEASRETEEIDGIEVLLRTGEGGCEMATWERGDFQYLVHSNQQQGGIPADELQALVEGLDSTLAESAVSVPGTADA